MAPLDNMEETEVTHNTTVFHKFPLATNEAPSIVYIITDVDQKPWQVTGLLYSASGSLQYRIEQGITSTWAFECQLSDERDIALKTSN